MDRIAFENKVILFNTTLIIYFVILFTVAGCGNHDSENNLAHVFPPTPNLNVLIISFDSLRTDSLGIYNSYTKKTSPHINYFASNALIFDNAYTAGYDTPSSFASSFTGKYTFRAWSGGRLIDNYTLGSVFQKNGYKTFFITNNIQLTPQRGFDQGFDFYKLLEKPRDNEMLATVLTFLSENTNSQFFGWFHFMSPHIPYQYKNNSKHLYDETYKGEFQKVVPVTYEVESEIELKRVRSLYDGEVYWADTIFNSILLKLTQLNLTDETIVILTADHGEEFFEHGNKTHQSAFNEVIKIPFVIKHPCATLTGRINTLFSNVDLLPTLASITSLNFNHKYLTFDGRDLLGGNIDNREIISTSAFAGKEHRQMAFVQKESSFIYSCYDAKGYYYNLVEDPYETNNIFVTLNNDEQRQLILNRDKIYLPYCKGNNTFNAHPLKNFNSKEIETLKSLGYAK